MKAEGLLRSDLVIKQEPGIHNMREMEIVAIVKAMRCRGEKKELEIVDVSQSLGRRAWGEAYPTLTTSSTLYCVKAQRALVPREHFVMQGYPCEVSLEGLSLHQQRNLAGEAVAPPCAAFITWAIVLCLPSD